MPELGASALLFGRYATVGLVCGVVYAAVVVLCVQRLQLGAAGASALGYAIAIPVSYLGHRLFTFRSKARLLPESGRFLLVQLVCIGLAFAIMYSVTELAEGPLWLGIGLCIALLPIGGFLAMKLLVFVVGGADSRGRRADS